MVSWHELHIQSNLPIVILFILLISFAIIGFLEYRKLSHRIDELTNRINKKPEILNQKKEVLNKKETVHNEDIPLHVDKKDYNNEDSLINHDLKGQESIVGMDVEGLMRNAPNITGMVLGGGPIMSMNIPMQMPDIIQEGMLYEEDIKNNNINNDDVQNDIYSDVDEEEKEKKELDIEDITDLKNKLELTDDNQKEETNSDSDSVSNVDSESDSYSDTCSEITNSSNSSNREITQPVKEKDKKGEIEINRSLSIKELKVICQELNISTSGNKEQLIKRINNKKNN